MKISRSLKLAVIAVATAAALFLAIDFAAGMFRRVLMKSPASPEKMDYLLRNADEDIIIIGNSAGEYNIVPQNISDSTGMSAFNASESGTGLNFTMAQAEILLAHHRPKLLIVALNPRNFREYDPKAGFEKLKPLYDRGYALVDSLLEKALPDQRLLLKSNLWLLNADLMPRVSGALGLGSPIYLDTKGYRPHPSYGHHPQKLLEEPIRFVPSNAIVEFDRLRRLAVRSSVPLLVVFPPNYVFGNEWEKSQFMSQVKVFDSVIVWNDTDHPDFKNDSTNFFDCLHLTDEAASRYSDTIASRLKKMMQ